MRYPKLTYKLAIDVLISNPLGNPLWLNRGIRPDYSEPRPQLQKKVRV
jgi:hypothetical protein